MTSGTVKFFNTSKGFGFIIPDDGSGDVFFHVSELEKAGIDQVSDGQKVSYELETNRGKTCAANIQLQDPA